MPKLGLSGDSIFEDGHFIVKICETNQERFARNVEKQKSFNSAFINAVPITRSGVTQLGQYYIVMPLLKCDNSVIWLSRSNIIQFKRFCNLLHNYFNELFAKAELREFPHDVWIKKIDDLSKKINDKQLYDVLQQLRIIRSESPFYHGDYHGDLTLTNLFLSNDNDLEIDAIDFLESFIHSPINDIVKIRQDTRHLWTMHLLRNSYEFDRGKVMILLDYVDKSLVELIASKQSIRDYYLPFQIMNLMRIIPYNKDAETFEYLKKEILGLSNELDSNNAMRGPLDPIQHNSA